MTVTENRLRDALSAAATTSVEVRPLTVGVRRRSRIPMMLTAAAAVLLVVSVGFGTVRLASPTVPDGGSAVIMSGGDLEPSDMSGVRVFLCGAGGFQIGCAGGATEKEREDILRTLQARPEVAGVLFRDRKTAFEDFQRQYKDDPTMLKNLTLKDTPDSFIVGIRPGADATAVLRAVSELPGVASAVDVNCLLERASLWWIIKHAFSPEDDRPSCLS